MESLRIVYEKHVKELFEIMINTRLGNSQRVYKLLKGWGTSAQGRVPRDQIYLLPETTKNTGQNIWNDSFQSTRHQAMKISDSWEMGKQWGKPVDFIHLLQREFPGYGTGRGKSQAEPSWADCMSVGDKVQGDQGRWSFQDSTQEERAIQRESQRGAEGLTSKCMWRNYPSLGENISEKISKQHVLLIQSWE